MYIGKIPTVGNFQICDAITVVDAQAAYTMQVDTVDVSPESANHMIVSLNGVIQKPTDAYTVSGSTITFASALETGDVIDFIQILGNVLDLGVPSDATVSTAKIVDGAVTSAKLTYPLTTFSSTGIDDNADATAITINSSEQVEFTAGTVSLPAITTTGDVNTGIFFPAADTIAFAEGGAEAMRIDSSGNLLISKTSTSDTVTGLQTTPNGALINVFNASGYNVMNRQADDGVFIYFKQANSNEGNISVSGTTVSYNGFTGTHWTRLADNSKPTILRGTVLETLDEMVDWYNLEFDVTTTTQDEDGNNVINTVTEKIPHLLTGSQSVGDIITYDNNGTDVQATIVREADVKHMKSKVSDNSEAKNIYGVFSHWDFGDDDGINDIIVASVGSYVVRIKSGETLAKGDLLQSNGDGTAKVQSDDNIKSSSFAKVLSTTVIETYEDGSYLVPCSLMC
jgi:hypothetical protein